MSERADRQNAFGTLRLILATFVIFSHSPALIDGHTARDPLSALSGVTLGELAVNGFFALSGFLLAQSWSRAPSLPRYLIRRSLRIYPGYAVASVASVLVVGALGALDPGRYLGEVGLLSLLGRTAMLGEPLTPPTFVGQPYPSVNGSLWTVRYEFACYLLIPILGVAGTLRSRRATVATVCGFILLFATSSYWIGWLGLTPVDGLGRHLARGARLSTFFLAGAGAAVLSLERVPRLGVFVALMLAGAAALRVLGHGAEPFLAPVVIYAVLYLGLSGLRRTTTWFQTNDYSYGVYLYAWPIQKLGAAWMPGIEPWQLSAVTFVGAFSLGAASWHFIERPALDLAARLCERLPPLPVRTASSTVVDEAAGR